MITGSVLLPQGGFTCCSPHSVQAWLHGRARGLCPEQNYNANTNCMHHYYNKYTYGESGRHLEMEIKLKKCM